MKDNKTSQPAGEYDGNIGKTMPFYDLFHANAIGLVEVVKPDPQQWLDTGCGTGTLAARAAERFGQTRFVLADPSPAMLDLAKAKLTGPAFDFCPGGTEELCFDDESFDVITAILAHHYYSSPEDRRRAAGNCFRMLKPDGIYVNFESFRPTSELGFRIAIEGWRRAQLARGKQEAAVEKYLSRCGVEFFPATLEENVRLLRETGFCVVEIFWLSGMQAGMYAIK
jgi:tRNA (cmo5U34)-methyltransferase